MPNDARSYGPVLEPADLPRAYQGSRSDYDAISRPMTFEEYADHLAGYRASRYARSCLARLGIRAADDAGEGERTRGPRAQAGGAPATFPERPAEA